MCLSSVLKTMIASTRPEIHGSIIKEFLLDTEPTGVLDVKALTDRNQQQSEKRRRGQTSQGATRNHYRPT